MTEEILDHGYVADRILISGGFIVRTDTPNHMGLPAKGTVTFVPLSDHQYVNGDPATRIAQEHVVCRINQDGGTADQRGMLIDPFGNIGGVQLPVGPYHVVTRIEHGNLPAFDIVVTDQHTQAAPLWLAQHAPLKPTPYERFVVNEQVYLDTQAARDDAVQARNEVNQVAQTTLDAGYTAEQFDARMTSVEAMAGLAPGEVTDAQTANLVEQPDTLTRQRLNHLLADKADRDELAQLTETDYVEMLGKMSYYDDISFRRTRGDEFEVSLRNTGITQHIDFMRPDDYFKMSGIRLASAGYIPSDQDVSVTDLTYTGNWRLFEDNLSYARYAQTVGDYAEYEFTIPTTADITFRHRVNDQGGIMRVTLNGSNPVDVSTYAGTQQDVTDLVHTGLPAGTHTIRFEFMGDDPDNPPSGGAGTSRGWLTNAANPDPVYVLEIRGEEQTNSGDDLLMADTSNKEFAFALAPPGGTNWQWIPQHATPTGVQRTEPVFILDGVQYTLSELAIGQEYTCQDFKLVQDIYGRNPDSETTNLVNVKTVHAITRDGNINVSGSMTVLQDTQIGSSYVIMAPVNNEIFTVLQTGWGNRYATTKTDNTDTTLDEGADCANYIYLTEDQDYYVAFRHTDKRGNFDLGGAAEKGYDNLINHRDETIVKHYLNIFDRQTLPAGYKYRWSGDYLVGRLKGVHDLMSA